MIVRNIPIDKIDLTDRTFALTPGHQPDVSHSLLDSIRRIGMLHPPVIRVKGQDGFQPIVGRKRLLVARDALHLTTCDCLVLPAELTDADALALALEDILISRPATPVERALFCRKILLFLGEKEAGERFLPLMGLPPHPFHFRRCLSLLNLAEPVLASLHEGALDEAAALELVSLPLAEQLLLHGLIRMLSLGPGKQKKLIAGVKELALRTGVAVTEMLSDRECANILHHPEANVPQKATNLLAWLDRSRLPRLSSAEQAFNRLKKRLELPRGILLTHTPSFEDDTMTLSIPFRTRAELAELWRIIEARFAVLPE